MHMRRLVQLAMSGVLVLGSFAFAEEPDWTGRSQQEREADSSDSGTKTPRIDRATACSPAASLAKIAQIIRNGEPRCGSCLFVSRGEIGRRSLPATGKTGFPVLPRASSPALPANSPVQDQVRGFCASARILATCPFGRVIPSGFACCPSLRSDRRLLGSRSRAPALTGTGRPLRGSGEKTPWRNSAKHSARPMPRQRRS